MRPAAFIALTFAAVSATLALASPPRPAAAQDYTRPAPRSTDPAKMLADARRREAAERIAIAVKLENDGEWARAAGELQRALTIDPPEPMNSTARYDLGLAFAKLGRLDDARVAFAAAVARDGGFIAARVNLVAVDLMRDDLAAARRDADALLERAPESALGLYQRGIASLRQGDAASALRDFGALLARDPSYATGRYDLALAEMKLGRLDDAERDLRAALALSPAYARARFALGAVLLRAGKRDAARAEFERAANDARDPTLRSLAQSFRDEAR